MNDLFDEINTVATSAVGATTKNNNYHPHPPRDGSNTIQTSGSSSIQN